MNTISAITRGGIIVATIVAVWLIFSIGRSPESRAGDGLEGTISVSGAFALYPMVVRWAEEFRKIHPNVTFNISAGGAGKGISDALGGFVDLGAVSREINPEETRKGAWPIAVTKDAVVPTVSRTNPNIDAILARGLSREAFTRIYIDRTYTDWSQAGFPVRAAINPYTRSDASGAGETWGKYLGRAQENLAGTGVFGDPGLLKAVKNDPGAIGYNNIGYVYNATTRRQLDGIAVVPIDLDGDGAIGDDERFYETLDELSAAIAAGRYPSPPARDLYLVSKGKPERREVAAFLKWVLREGQRYVGESGYIELSKERLARELGRLDPDA